MPKAVTVVRDASHLLSFGWVRIDATDQIASFSEDLIDKRDDSIRQRTYARLTAEVTGPNRIDVHTDHVRQYTLYLNDELVDLSSRFSSPRTGRRPSKVWSFHRSIRCCGRRASGTTLRSFIPRS